MVIFHSYALKTPCLKVHQIWHSCRGRRSNHHHKLFGDRLRGVDSVGVESCHFPLTKAIAVNSGLVLQRSHLWPNRRNTRVLWEIGVQEHNGDVRFQIGSRNKAGSRMRIKNVPHNLNLWPNHRNFGALRKLQCR